MIVKALPEQSLDANFIVTKEGYVFYTARQMQNQDECCLHTDRLLLHECAWRNRSPPLWYLPNLTGCSIHGSVWLPQRLTSVCTYSGSDFPSPLITCHSCCNAPASLTSRHWTTGRKTFWSILDFFLSPGNINLSLLLCHQCYCTWSVCSGI